MVDTFSKNICPKVDMITQVEFELAYYDVAVQHLRNNYKETPPRIFVMVKKVSKQILTESHIYTISLSLSLYIYIYIYNIEVTYSWGCRIHRQHLYRVVRPPPPTRVLDMTLNYLLVRLQSWSSRECGVPLSLPSLPGPL